MASWSDINSGQTQGNAQLGFTKSPFTFSDNSSSSSVFGGSDSSLTASNSALPTGSVFGSSLFGQNSANTTPFATQPPFKSPFSTNQTGGDPIPFKNSTSIFQQTSNPFPTLQQPSKFSSSAGSSLYVSNPTGRGPFSSVNSTSLFGQTINVPTTSLFGTGPFNSQFSSTSSPPISPFGTSSMISSSQSPVTSFGTTTTFSSGFGTSKASSTGSSIINTNSQNLVQANTSANNGSVFSPFTRSDLGISGIQGTRLRSYETTPAGLYETSLPVSEADGIFFSISAMPFYKSKSHEELRFEDYQLTGKTGGCPTETKSAHSSAVINISISVSPSPISSSSSLSTGTPGLCFVNPPSSDSQCLGFSVPSICNSYIPTPFLSVSHPVLLIPLSITTGHLGNLHITTQTTISSPASGTAPAFSNSPTTESIITSNPEPVSTGGFFPRFGSSTENKQQPIPQWPVSVRQPFVTNPIATTTLPKTVQYENYCFPVSDNAEPIKGFPIFNGRPLSLDRDTSPIEKYKPKDDEKKVTFNKESFPWVNTMGAAPFMPSFSNFLWSDNSTNTCERGTQSENIKHDDDHSANILKCQDHEDSSITAHYDDVIAMIPKLTCPEYYMEPSMDDLAANELKMPGFCSRVKDFVIGRRDYGSIKFLGETDVRNLDLESIVKFNMRDVKVCMDDKAKLPAWQGVYKVAEITLLNVKCIDKITEKQYIDGPKVDAYKQLLVSKTVEQGAEFVSFNPIKGEWRFKVQF